MASCSVHSRIRPHPVQRLDEALTLQRTHEAEAVFSLDGALAAAIAEKLGIGQKLSLTPVIT